MSPGVSKQLREPRQARCPQRTAQAVAVVAAFPRRQSVGRRHHAQATVAVSAPRVVRAWALQPLVQRVQQPTVAPRLAYAASKALVSASRELCSAVGHVVDTGNRRHCRGESRVVHGPAVTQARCPLPGWRGAACRPWPLCRVSSTCGVCQQVLGLGAP